MGAGKRCLGDPLTPDKDPSPLPPPFHEYSRNIQYLINFTVIEYSMNIQYPDESFWQSRKKFKILILKKK